MAKRWNISWEELRRAKEASSRKGTAGRRDHKDGAESSNKARGGKGAR